MQKDWCVVGFNRAVGFITMIARSANEVDAWVSALSAPSGFDHVTVFNPDGDAARAVLFELL